MFIAHLPAGYLAARGAERCGVRLRGLMASCLMGSIAPDLDLLYFYLVDSCRHHHHSYASHWPSLWLVALGTALLLLAWRRARWCILLVAFAACGVLHIAMDGVVGDIQLLAPWSHEYFALATVPARYKPWWLNFFLHWSMGIELLICAFAAVCFLARRSRRHNRPTS